MPKPLKDFQVKIRVTAAMKQQLDAIADQRGEAVAVIVREALIEYLAENAMGQSSDAILAADPAGTYTPGPSVVDKLLADELAARAAANRRSSASES